MTFLVCRLSSHYCALPLEHVVETMRPLPIEPFRGAPAYVRGTAVIRGQNVPVVSAVALLGGAAADERRFVTLRVGERSVALAVGDVAGVRTIDPETLTPLPSLLGPEAADVARSLGTLDEALLIVLSTGRLLSDEVWAALEAGARA